MGVQRCLIATLLLGVAVRVFAGPPWAPDSFPNPKIDTDKCGRGGKKSNICDPDHVLTAQGADRVEGILIEIYEGADPYVRAPCGATGLQGYQVTRQHALWADNGTPAVPACWDEHQLRHIRQPMLQRWTCRWRWP